MRPSIGLLYCLLFLSPLLGARHLPAKNNQNLVFVFQSKPQIVYQNNRLVVEGLQGLGRVEVYTLIGNKVADFDRVDLRNAALQLTLIPNNLYIVRVLHDDGRVHTFKLRAS